MEPSTVAYEQYEEAVRKQHENGVKLPYPHFDRLKGWGYSFKDNNDFWTSVKETG